MKKLVIVPDVHGRTFWKAVIPFVEEGIPCIFLGDYTDPYSIDNISDIDVLKNLREIFSLARTYSDRVSLLLGNHDLSYLGDPFGIWTVYADRFCYNYADVIADYYNENADIFSLCTFREIGSEPILFSHAGMHPVWVELSHLFDDIDTKNAKALADRVDKLYHESLSADERTEFMEALAMVGSYRGGHSFAGSMVWADCREYDNTDSGFTQIFGHTAQRRLHNEGKNLPYVVGNNICIDCERCFYLDQDARLHCLENDEPVT